MPDICNNVRNRVKMAFTAENLAQIEAAIITVASGGVAEISDGLGNKVRYSSIDELTKLKGIIEKDIFQSARTSGFDKFKFASKESA